MEKKENEQNHLKIVHKSESVKSDNKKPLSHEELMAKLSTLGTVHEREQLVIENLRRKGLT